MVFKKKRKSIFLTAEERIREFVDYNTKKIEKLPKSEQPKARKELKQALIEYTNIANRSERSLGSDTSKDLMGRTISRNWPKKKNLLQRLNPFSGPSKYVLSDASKKKSSLKKTSGKSLKDDKTSTLDRREKSSFKTPKRGNSTVAKNKKAPLIKPKHIPLIKPKHIPLIKPVTKEQYSKSLRRGKSPKTTSKPKILRGMGNSDHIKAERKQIPDLDELKIQRKSAKISPLKKSGKPRNPSLSKNFKRAEEQQFNAENDKIYNDTYENPPSKTKTLTHTPKKRWMKPLGIKFNVGKNTPEAKNFVRGIREGIRDDELRKRGKLIDAKITVKDDPVDLFTQDQRSRQQLQKEQDARKSKMKKEAYARHYKNEKFKADERIREVKEARNKKLAAMRVAAVANKNEKIRQHGINQKNVKHTTSIASLSEEENSDLKREEHITATKKSRERYVEKRKKDNLSADIKSLDRRGSDIHRDELKHRKATEKSITERKRVIKRHDDMSEKYRTKKTNTDSDPIEIHDNEPGGTSRICPSCGTVNHRSMSNCVRCGAGISHIGLVPRQKATAAAKKFKQESHALRFRLTKEQDMQIAKGKKGKKIVLSPAQKRQIAADKNIITFDRAEQDASGKVRHTRKFREGNLQDEIIKRGTELVDHEVTVGGVVHKSKKHALRPEKTDFGAVCSSCNKPAVFGDKFCTGCGYTFVKGGNNICQKCNSAIIPGNAFCTQCGAKVKKANTGLILKNSKYTKPSAHAVNVHKDDISKIENETRDNNLQLENTDLPESSPKKPKRGNFLQRLNPFSGPSEQFATADDTSPKKLSFRERISSRLRRTPKPQNTQETNNTGANYHAKKIYIEDDSHEQPVAKKRGLFSRGGSLRDNRTSLRNDEEASLGSRSRGILTGLQSRFTKTPAQKLAATAAREKRRDDRQLAKHNKQEAKELKASEKLQKLVQSSGAARTWTCPNGHVNNITTSICPETGCGASMITAKKSLMASHKNEIKLQKQIKKEEKREERMDRVALRKANASEKFAKKEIYDGKVGNRKWNCRKCGHLNDAANTVCDVCRLNVDPTKKIFRSDARNSIVKKIRQDYKQTAQEWQCPKCFAKNIGGVECKNCNAPRGWGSRSKSRLWSGAVKFATPVTKAAALVENAMGYKKWVCSNGHMVSGNLKTCPYCEGGNTNKLSSGGKTPSTLRKLLKETRIEERARRKGTGLDADGNSIKASWTCLKCGNITDMQFNKCTSCGARKPLTAWGASQAAKRLFNQATRKAMVAGQPDILCPFCRKGKVSAKGGVCPKCNNTIRGAGNGGPMPKMFNAYNFAKYRFKQKMLETAILWILAILAAVTFNYIFFAIAILIYSFYIVFPSEKSIMMDAKKNGRQVYACPVCGQTMGQYGGMPMGMGMMGGMGQAPDQPDMPDDGWSCGHKQPLVLRTESKMTSSNLNKLIIGSMLKIFVIIFTIIEFGFVHPQNGPVTMVMLFVLYFWLPLSYFTGKISGAIESWFRMFFAIPLGLAMVGFLNPDGATSLILNGAMILTQNLPQLLFSAVPLTIMLMIALTRDRKQEKEEGINKNYYMLFVAFAVIIVIYGLFGPILDTLYTSGNYVQMSMFYLVLAFFMTAPNRKISVESFEMPGIKYVMNIGPDDIQNLYAKIKDGSGSMWLVQSSMYYAFVIQAALPIIRDLTSGASKELMYITAAIWILSTLIGAAPGSRTTRPYIGVMLIIFSLLLFSFQYTGTIGTAVFGQWWPSVYSVGSGVMEPISDAFESIGETMEDYSLMASCYDCWVAKKEKEKQDQQGILARGKTTRALELENFNAVNYETLEPNIDPMLSLIGDAQIINKGDFDAEQIIITIGDLQTYDPVEVSIADSKAGKTDLNDECVFTYCSGDLSDDKRICYLLEPLYPSDKIQITFECGDPDQNYSNWSTGGKNDLLTCQCAKYKEKKDAVEKTFGADAGSNDECTWEKFPMNSCSKELMTACTKSKDSVCGKEGIVSYTKARWMIEIPIRYQFEYSVSSTLNVDVMTRTLFDNLDEQPKEKDSEYSGGPIKLSVWTQNQPLRSDSTSFGKLTVLNTGKGKLLEGTEVYANIEVPVGLTISDLEISSMIGMENCTFDELKLVCELRETLDKDDSANVLFRFNVNLEEPVQQKTFTVTGNIDNYIYTGENDIALAVASAPAFQ